MSVSDRPDAAARGRPRDAGADDRILGAAFRQLVAVGYGGLSMESVAADAGVAKTTVYRRYPTKRDLVLAALTTAVPVPPAPPADMPARDGIDWFVRMAATALVESGAIRILATLLVEDQREPGLLDSFRERLVAPRRMMVVGLLETGMARGEVRADVDPLVVTELVAGAIFGHHLILGQPVTDEWISTVVDHVWSAIERR